LDPGRAPKPASLRLAKHRRRLGDWLDNQPGLVAEIARDELADINRLTEQINTLAQRIGERVRAIAPALLAMPGCGELTAAKIIGETAGVERFKHEAAFARHSGVAPIPVWSGNTAGRVRMTRSGNRQLNAALHRIAITQIRLDGLGQTYYRKRLATGDSNPEALRCLKRRLARVVFNRLKTDHQPAAAACAPAAA
jgi:transposase